MRGTRKCLRTQQPIEQPDFLSNCAPIVHKAGGRGGGGGGSGEV